MPPINVLSAALVVLMFSLVLRAYLPLLSRSIGPFGYYMMRGAIMVAVVSILRSGYWDVGQWMLGPWWVEVRAILGGQQFSALFNLGLLWAGCDLIKARYHLIPDDEQRHWRWWTAWAHPGDRCVFDWRKK